MNDIIWHNGEFKNDEPILSIHDRLRLGEGLFNTILCIDGTLIHGEEHMQKLLDNTKFFVENHGCATPETLVKIAEELLQKNNATQGRNALNTIFTLGNACNGIRTPETPDIQMMMRIQPCTNEFPEIHAIIAQTIRRNEGSPLSQIKCSNYGDNIIALREAQNQNANEAIIMNNAGHITCATTSNIVIIKNGKFITPPLKDGCQNGITRSILMKKFEVTEQSITPEDLYTSEGIYLLNSLRGAAPIVTLNGKTAPKPAIAIDKDFYLH
ncbi:aminotransferase class IV [Alphaproteobacteria bacterium]|nr:aminotransferase class IV [Alphaproteobacteria bacterium]